MTGAAVLDQYSETLLQYCRNRGEDALYQASLMSDACIRDGLGPDEIVAAHLEATQRLMAENAARPSDRVALIASSHQFLLEMMIGYGVKYREYLELKLAEAARDADELLRLERERAEQAVRSEAEKVEILGVIAHELGTPLTIAKGNAELLQRALTNGGTHPEISTSARDLTGAIERIEQLTGRIVAASNDKQPDVILEPQVMHRIIERCVAWASVLAAEKGTSVTAECEKDIWVLGDADGLISLTTNLLQNAVRYTPAGGRVRVMCRDAGEMALLEVSDTGIGMSESVRARIFEKFYRAPEARRTSASGLGMGLVIVERLVEAHNGRIEVDSREGEGTTFRVFLPKATDIDQEGME